MTFLMTVQALTRRLEGKGGINLKNLKEELKNKTVISWGGYEYLKNNLEALKGVRDIDCICADSRYMKVSGYRIVQQGEILNLKDPFVIISQAREKDIRKAADWCRQNNVPFTHLSFVSGKGMLDAHMVMAIGGSYTDFKNNTVTISPLAQGEILVDLSQAEDAVVQIEKIHVKGRLNIKMYGSGGTCMIGEGTTFVRTSIEVNAGGIVEIGKDCMFSNQISVMQSDMHMIFDMHTRKRINHAKPVRIGNHVWVGHGAELLGGAEIDDNSVVGSCAVTSGKFPKNVIIAGCPAKVIREDVIWSRDLIKNGFVDDFSECRDQAALKYLDALAETDSGEDESVVPEKSVAEAACLPDDQCHEENEGFISSREDIQSGQETKAQPENHGPEGE